MAVYLHQDAGHVALMSHGRSAIAASEVQCQQVRCGFALRPVANCLANNQRVHFEWQLLKN